MRNQLVERSAGLHVEVSANQKLERSPIAAIELELMRTIIRQTSVGVVEQALKIEQRSDVRIRLSVVVTEEAFVVTGQAREHIGSDELIVVSKPLRGCELDGAVETLRAAETARRAGGTLARCSLGRAGLVAAWIEDEVRVAIIKRAIFDHVSHVPINSTGTEGEILFDLVQVEAQLERRVFTAGDFQFLAAQHLHISEVSAASGENHQPVALARLQRLAANEEQRALQVEEVRTWQAFQL